MAISLIPTQTKLPRQLPCQGRLQVPQWAVQDPTVTPLQLHRQWQPACLPRQRLQQVMLQGQEGTALLHVRCTRLMFRALPRSIQTRASRSRPSGLPKLSRRDSRHRSQRLLHQ